MNNPVVHFEILGRDGAALVAFYRQLFGWELRDATMEGYSTYSFLPSPDEGIGGGVGQLQSVQQSFVTIYVEVADARLVLEDAIRHGAQVVLEVNSIPGVGDIARFRDPQGNIIGLVRSVTPN
jgi:predicted enzyme related to lactoylglutathione lyase